jgi:F-type H+-transporting ATPase subunit delta
VLRSADEAFIEFWDEDRSVLRAQATSALPLSRDEKAVLTRALASLSRATVELETSVDRALIGGVAVRFRDRLIDGSIGGKLKRLSERLQEY